VDTTILQILPWLAALALAARYRQAAKMDRILHSVAEDYHLTAKTAPRALRAEFRARAALYGLLADLPPKAAQMAYEALHGLPLGFLTVQEDSTGTLDTLPQATVQVTGSVTCLDIQGDLNRQVLESCLPAIKKAKYVHLTINSPGGYGIVGLALFDALRGRPDTIGSVRHVCASAASFALMGCRTRQIERDAWIMVHSPRHYAGGPLAKLESALAELKRCQRAAGECFQRCHPGSINWFNLRNA